MDPDQTAPRSSLIRVHMFACMQKQVLKSLQEYSADDINRRHFQMKVFLAFYWLRGMGTLSSVRTQNCFVSLLKRGLRGFQ